MNPFMAPPAHCGQVTESLPADVPISFMLYLRHWHRSPVMTPCTGKVKEHVGAAR